MTEAKLAAEVAAQVSLQQAAVKHNEAIAALTTQLTIAAKES
jgi:hypothetical protein